MILKENLNKLKTKDIYTLLLFALYQIKNIPEYSTLSELVYVLDKNNLLKLCEIFGGTTITIPTIEELESLTYSLMLYQYVNIDGMNIEDALKLIKTKTDNIKQIKSDYFKLVNILENYNFDR